LVNIENLTYCSDLDQLKKAEVTTFTMIPNIECCGRYIDPSE